MNVLILHGIGGKAGIHWQQWLHDKLVQEGHHVVMPTLSDPDHPDRQTWLFEIKNYMKDLTSNDTVMIAHSLGVPSAFDYLEQTDDPIKAFVSVSGFAYPLGTELNEYFMIEKPIDFNKIITKIGQAFVIYGDNDPYVNQTALAALANELSVTPTIIHNGGHINTDAGFTELPIILEILKGIK